MCQKLTVYTDHKNLIQDALGLTCDWVYQWQLLLEEYGPEIVYIKGIHNTVADAISPLEFVLSEEPKAAWMTFTKCWCFNNMHLKEDQSPTAHKEDMNLCLQTTAKKMQFTHSP